MRWECEETDYLVIGSGVAGLRCAIELSNSGNVLVLAKSVVEEGSTEYAQGGVAVALSDDDEISFHEQDTLRAGAGLCNPQAVKILVTEGPQRVEELIQWGASFDTEHGKLWFTREGAHSRNRVIHSRGDSTGAEIERTLLSKASPLENITFWDHAFTLDLIAHDGVCKGAYVLLGPKSPRLVVVKANATILATGGAGQVYKVTTNPAVSTGDGVAIAFRAGAEIVDMEFVQFHPTTLHKSGVPTFLLSEAMRGEGGVLRNAHGEQFMPRYHADAELAPRDVVARAIISEIRRTKSPEIYLDLRHLPPGFVRKRFPRIYDTCVGYGLRADRDLLPVHPAAHYLMGGVKTDLEGRTTLPGLFACGEVACTGVHGANRLASNSLLEGVVFGRRAGVAAQEMLGKQQQVPTGQVESFAKRLKPIPAGTVARIKQARERVRSLMWERVGIIRDASGLQEAARTLAELVDVAEVLTTNPAVMEARNIFYNAVAIRFAAQMRTESRGAHFRSDFPHQDDATWLKHLSFSSRAGLETLLSQTAPSKR